MNTNTAPTETTVTLKILGPGCANCKRLEANVRQAVEQLGVQAELEKVEDITDIMAYGVMRTPALVVNEQVLFYGRVPSIPEIKALLSDSL